MTSTLSRSLKAIFVVGAILSLSGCLNYLSVIVDLHSDTITSGEEPLREDSELAADMLSTTGAQLTPSEQQKLLAEIGKLSPDQKVKLDATMRTLNGHPVYSPGSNSDVVIDFTDPQMKEAATYINDYFKVPDGSNGLLFIQQLMATSL